MGALQVQVVLIDLPRRYRHSLLTVSIGVALLAIMFRIAATVINAQQILASIPSDSNLWILDANVSGNCATGSKAGRQVLCTCGEAGMV